MVIFSLYDYLVAIVTRYLRACTVQIQSLNMNQAEFKIQRQVGNLFKCVTGKFQRRIVYGSEQNILWLQVHVCDAIRVQVFESTCLIRYLKTVSLFQNKVISSSEIEYSNQIPICWTNRRTYFSGMVRLLLMNEDKSPPGQYSIIR